MTWIRTSYDRPSHEVADYRERVVVGGAYRWQARTLCGRTITGLSGGSAYRPECASCRKVLDREEER